MAKHTHEAIMTAFTELIHEMPFDRITVSELVRRSGISPNTFYYHYKDIYELLGDWLRHGLLQFSEENPDIRNWKEIIKKVMRLCKRNEMATYHIYNSLSRAAFERFAFMQTEDLIKSGIEQICARTNIEIPEDKMAMISNTCKFMLLGLFLQFVWNKMTDDIDETVDNFTAMMEDFLSAELTRFSTSKGPHLQ